MAKELKNIIIAYDCANINGGAAKVAIQSAIVLSHGNNKVYFFAASGPVDEQLQKSKVTVKCLGIDDINHGSKLAAIKNGIWNREVEREFGEFLTEFSPDETIVHIHGWAKALSSAVVKVACDKGFKTFITLHDYFTLCPNGGFYDYQKQEICTRKPMSLACMLCNCDKRNYAQKIWRVARQIVQDWSVRKNPNLAFISISQKNEDIVRPYVKSREFYRVDNPVQLAEYQIEDCSKSNRFLYIGRLSEEKGIELFCQAITELKVVNDIEGIVVGDGVLYETLKNAYPTVQFEGWKSAEEVQGYIQSARALVLPSKWYEGAPLTIIEAMSAGLPCIVSDCTSATEVIEDGINGLIFKNGNVSSLKSAIEKVLDKSIAINLQQNLMRTFEKRKYTDYTHTSILLKGYNEWLNH